MRGGDAELTAQSQQPKARCACDIQELDIACEERGVGASEGEYTSGLLLARIWDVAEPREPKGHFRAGELVTLGESLPEGRRAGRGNSVESETHDAGHRAIEEIRRGLVYRDYVWHCAASVFQSTNVMLRK